MAQRDPLVEYQREGFDLFVAMMEAIKEESVGYMFNAEVTVTPHVHSDGQEEEIELETKGLVTTKSVAALQYSAAEIEPTPAGGTSKNAPCPCGSGKKYKKCCGK